MPSALVLALLAVSALVTSFISGILGMAGGMILMGILLAVLPLPVAMMLHGITQLASNGWRALPVAQEVDWRVFRGYLYGALLATALLRAGEARRRQARRAHRDGLHAVHRADAPREAAPQRRAPRPSARCGVICSVLSLTAGVSGPILDVFFVRSKMTRHAVVATKAMTQSLSHILKILYFGAFRRGRGRQRAPAPRRDDGGARIHRHSLSRRVPRAHERRLVPLLDALDREDPRRLLPRRAGVWLLVKDRI
jgi:uncharacterized membrane protein YfcA